MQLEQIILGVAGAVTLGVSAWIVQTIRSLTNELAALRIELTRFEERLAHLPPQELLLRIDRLEGDVKTLIDKVADC